MTKKHQNSQVNKSTNQTERSKISKSLVIQILLILSFNVACTNIDKSNKPASNKLELSNKGTAPLIDGDLKNSSKDQSHQKTDYEEFIKNQKSWDELKSILANDIVSAKELGIVVCSAFKRPSVEIELQNPFKAWRLKKQNESWILNTFYKWNTYELNGKDLCIEMLKPDQGFLSELDSRVLLSAYRNYQFKKLNLLPVINVNQKIYYSNTGKKCGQLNSSNDKNISILKNDCIEVRQYWNNNIPDEAGFKYEYVN